MRSSSGRHTASPPSRSARRRVRPRRACAGTRPACAVQPDHRRQLGRIHGPHVPRHMADRERLDGPSPRPRSSGPSAGSTARRTCGRHERPLARGAVGRDDPPSRSPSRNAPIALPRPTHGPVEPFVDGSRRPVEPGVRKGWRTGKVEGREVAAAPRSGYGWLDKRSGSPPPLRRAQPSRPSAEMTTPSRPASGPATPVPPSFARTGHLPSPAPPRAARTTQRTSSARPRRRVFDAEQSAATGIRQVAVARGHAVARGLRRLPLSNSSRPSRWCSSL